MIRKNDKIFHPLFTWRIVLLILLSIMTVLSSKPAAGQAATVSTANYIVIPLPNETLTERLRRKTRPGCLFIEGNRLVFSGSFIGKSDSHSTALDRLFASMSPAFQGLQEITPERQSEAFAQIKSAAEHGSVQAMGEMAAFYSEGVLVKADPVEAAKWRKKQEEAKQETRERE